MLRLNWLMAVALCATVFVACGKQEVRVELAQGKDDGSVSLLTHLQPNLFGFVYGSLEECRVGIGVSGGGDTLLGRPVFRFKIADWTKGEITFHFRYNNTSGTPGLIQVFCIKNFGALRDTGPADISWLWQAADSGRMVGEPLFRADSTFEAVAPESVVTAMKSSDNYLAFMLKLKNEGLLAENWVRITNYEYAETHDAEKPYLTWKK